MRTRIMGVLPCGVLAIFARGPATAAVQECNLGRELLELYDAADRFGQAVMRRSYGRGQQP